MKKLSLVLAAVLLVGGISFGQAAQTAPAKTTDKKMDKKGGKMDKKMDKKGGKMDKKGSKPASTTATPSK